MAAGRLKASVWVLEPHHEDRTKVPRDTHVFLRNDHNQLRCTWTDQAGTHRHGKVVDPPILYPSHFLHEEGRHL